MSLKQKHILIVHTAVDPRPYTTDLAGLGCRFSLLKKRPAAEDYACFDRVIDFDYEADLEAGLALAERLHREHPVHGVLSFSETGVIMASLIAARLGLPGNPPLAVLRARNKYLMRKAFRDAGLPTPGFHLVRTAREIHTLLRREGRPMVLKPISGSSSYGVIRLRPENSLEEIEAHLESVRTYICAYREQNPQYPFEFWLPPAGYGIPEEAVFDPSEVFLLEGFIGGQQVSVDGIVSGGRVSCLGVIEIERIKDTHYFLEYEEWMPTRMGDRKEGEIQRVVERAVKALGLTCGCFHCELKVGPEGIFVIEIAARRGADNISDFLRRVMGVNIYEEGLRLAVGERRVYKNIRPLGCMKMRYFLPETSGVLVAVEGEEEVRNDPRVSELDLEFTPGDRVLAPPEGYEFLGYISVFGRTPQEAHDALEALYAQVEFHIDPAPALNGGRALEMQIR